ncbi:hypothetical protein V6N11_028649 [Hibiscus sabdariffa]|uniref:Uncharacterized protein n=1 Tax=Hibiscus sabdariffa TaxID=183260 RepID=A0ABR2PQE8_9ROSI
MLEVLLLHIETHLKQSSRWSLCSHPSCSRSRQCSLYSHRSCSKSRLCSEEQKESRSAQPVESLVNWVVSEKQRLNGRFDKYYTHKELKFVCRLKMEVSRYEIFGIRPQRPKKTKFNQEQTQTPKSMLALPWKDKAIDQEVKEFINESLKENAQG